MRLVHSGAAVAGRNLELTIDVVSSLPERFSLDLYLVPANDGGSTCAPHRARAGGGRIRFLDPVPPMQLPDTLNRYDLGVFWLPPVHTNGHLTLPNKYFDYVQARLGIAVGPSPEMADLTRGTSSAWSRRTSRRRRSRPRCAMSPRRTCAPGSAMRTGPRGAVLRGRRPGGHEILGSCSPAGGGDVPGISPPARPRPVRR